MNGSADVLSRIVVRVKSKILQAARMIASLLDLDAIGLTRIGHVGPQELVQEDDQVGCASS